MSGLIDEIGNIYGRLTVVEQAPHGSKKAYWRCRCECGTEKIVRGSILRQGSTRSCGCLMRETAAEAGRIGGLKKAKIHAAKRARGDIVWHMTKKGYMRGYWPEHPLATGTLVLEHWHEYWSTHGKAEWVLHAKQMGATIHHINGIRDDNRPGNLELRWPGRHPTGWNMTDIIAVLREQGFTVIFPE